MAYNMLLASTINRSTTLVYAECGHARTKFHFAILKIHLPQTITSFPRTMQHEKWIVMAHILSRLVLELGMLADTHKNHCDEDEWEFNRNCAAFFCAANIGELSLKLSGIIDNLLNLADAFYLPLLFLSRLANWMASRLNVD